MVRNMLVIGKTESNMVMVSIILTVAQNILVSGGTGKSMAKEFYTMMMEVYMRVSG